MHMYVAALEVKMRKTELRWVGYIQIRATHVSLRIGDQRIFDGSKSTSSCPKCKWMQVIKRDMVFVKFNRGDDINRDEWTKRIYVAIPKGFGMKALLLL